MSLARRYLSQVEVSQTLGRGKVVAQLLGGATRPPCGQIIRWMTVSKHPDLGVVVTLIESEDVGSDDFVDIGEFPSIRGDEDPVTQTFASVDLALEYANQQLGASSGRFVDESVIDVEYAEFRRGT